MGYVDTVLLFLIAAAEGGRLWFAWKKHENDQTSAKNEEMAQAIREAQLRHMAESREL